MLSALLQIRTGMVVALVGAGGKTTTMFRLATEQVALGRRVITTTTTHIYPPKPEQSRAFVLEPDHTTLLERAAAALAEHPHITVARASAAEGKVRGIPPEWVADLHTLPGVDLVLVEADGAKKRLLKAPADYEPVIPACTDLVLLLASAEALGQPLSDAIAHRLERVEAVTGLRAGEPITPQALARLATQEAGLLKGVPPGAAAMLMLTHVNESRLAAAKETARLALAADHLAGVILASLDWAEIRTP